MEGLFGREISRKEMLALGLFGSAAMMLPLGRVARGFSIDGESPRYTPFSALMPNPAPLAPTSRTATTDYYTVAMREAPTEIIPGIQTRIWGYNGTYPGPTIRTRKNRKVEVRFVNNLPEGTSIHTHGAYVDGDSDGHPSDIIQPGAFKDYYFGNEQNARTQWYHDHVEHHTAMHVYKGLAGFYIIEDDYEKNLKLPSGAQDVPMVIADRLFNADGSLNYPSSVVSNEGFYGDVIAVNGKAQPRFEVAARKYRFRILNGSNARPYKLALSNGRSFTLIGTEGGLREKPVEITELPIWPAERYEVVIDFAKYPVGTKIVLKNLLGEQGTTDQVMRFDVVRKERETATVPAVLRPEADTLDATHLPTTVAAATVTRHWEFAKNNGLFTINGMIWDKNRIDAAPKEGATEIWEFENGGGGWAHPVHVHLLNFKILDRNGQPPLVHEQGWKETVILNEGDTARVLMKWPKVPVGPKPGPYVRRYPFHCHNVEHEDHDMMLQFEVNP